MSIIQLSELSENYNRIICVNLQSLIIQLSELSENYNQMSYTNVMILIIQLSELSENYNSVGAICLYIFIIQLSELSENYNEKSAHRWVGNFSLQILTDLHPSKIPSHSEFPVSHTSTGFWVGGIRHAVKNAECNQDFLLMQHTRGMAYQPHRFTQPTAQKPLRGYFTQSLRRQSLPH